MENMEVFSLLILLFEHPSLCSRKKSSVVHHNFSGRTIRLNTHRSNATAPDASSVRAIQEVAPVVRVGQHALSSTLDFFLRVTLNRLEFLPPFLARISDVAIPSSTVRFFHLFLVITPVDCAILRQRNMWPSGALIVDKSEA